MGVVESLGGQKKGAGEQQLFGRVCQRHANSFQPTNIKPDTTMERNIVCMLYCALDDLMSLQ